MFCYNCGEENPDEAKYCRNCGALLEKEKAKKVEVIEAPKHNEYHQQKTTSSTTGSSSDSNDNNMWIGCCCLGLVIVFIIAALL